MIQRLIRSKPVWSIFAMLVLSSFLSGTAIARPETRVRDGGEFFNSATIDQVNAIVAEIRQRFDRDLTIVTFNKIPDHLMASFSARSKDDFYNTWLTAEARNAGTKGIFILIVKNPKHLQIGVGDDTQKHIFTLKDRAELNETMLKAFRDKRFDQGVLEGAKFVLSRMQQNAGGGSGSVPTTLPTTQPAATEKPDVNGFK